MGIPTAESAISRFFIAHRFNPDCNPGSSGSILFTSAASVIGQERARDACNATPAVASSPRDSQNRRMKKRASKGKFATPRKGPSETCYTCRGAIENHLASPRVALRRRTSR